MHFVRYIVKSLGAQMPFWPLFLALLPFCLFYPFVIPAIILAVWSGHHKNGSAFAVLIMAALFSFFHFLISPTWRIDIAVDGISDADLAKISLIYLFAFAIFFFLGRGVRRFI